MTRLSTHASALGRDAFMVLATLAIALRIMIPTGFMPSFEPRNGLPFAMVLCTGQGAKIVLPGETLGTGEDHDRGGKSDHAAPCGFAAQGAAVAPPVVAEMAERASLTYAPPPIARTPCVTPGRGLAAPPPPPRGPPPLMI